MDGGGAVREWELSPNLETVDALTGNAKAKQ